MPEWNHFSAPLMVNTLVLFIFSGLFKISNQHSIKSTVYNIGVAVGISSFIFFPSIILFFWLIFALLVMRSVRLNEWLICLLGVTTPYYFYAAYLFFSDKWSWHTFISTNQCCIAFARTIIVVGYRRHFIDHSISYRRLFCPGKFKKDAYPSSQELEPYAYLSFICPFYSIFK